MTRYPGSLTDVQGIEVGHSTDPVGLTGCTVILCREGAIAGGLVRGYAPGTRETALLRPEMHVQRVHAILLTGGSAFGLAAADGVMRYLEEQEIGYQAGPVRVPIVPGAVLFDLILGDPQVRPGPEMGYGAARSAERSTPQGNVGAGTGATVGKLLGLQQAMKGGLGTASLAVGEIVVGAMVAVNAVGNIHDPETGEVLAGARRPDGPGFVDALSHHAYGLSAGFGNTVLGVVATNARLDVIGANRLAAAGDDGLARVVHPAHTIHDGDTLFALSTGDQEADPILVGEMAATAVARAIANAVIEAEDAGGVPAYRTLID